MTDVSEKDMQEVREAVKQFASQMLDEYPRARAVQVKLAEAIQSEPTNAPALLLTLAMFALSMRLSVQANFDMTPEQFDAAFEVASEVAEHLADTSKEIVVKDPRDGSIQRFKTSDAALG